MTQWKLPPDIKIYEALGSLADGRIELDGNSAKVFSSSRNKYYDVHYDQSTHAIMTNDNGSYWQGYLGYPAICYLMAAGEVDFDQAAAKALSGFDWKNINQSYKNDWEKTIAHVRSAILAKDPHFDLAIIDRCVENIQSQLRDQRYVRLGPRVKPPTGY